MVNNPPPIPGPTRRTLIGAVLPGSVISITLLVLLIAGVALFMSSETPAGKGTAVLLGLSGLSLFPIKDVKMFENAFKEIRPSFNFDLMKPIVETKLKSYKIGSFVEGTDNLRLSATSQLNECSEYISDLAKNNELALIIVVGHVDKRELQTEPLRVYGSNTALAYRRAIVVRDGLLKAYSARVVTLSGGPAHVGRFVTASDLEDDRNVEVFPYSVHLTRTPSGKPKSG